MKRSLILFAKEPIPGYVKTRLAKSLGNEKSAELYKCFLKDTIANINEANITNRIVAVEAFGKQAKYIKEQAHGFSFITQRGDNLGERIIHVIESICGNGTSKILIIGSDSPNLPVSYIEKAYRTLSRCDVVLGPAEDGGYYLIGFKSFYKDIFIDIPWSSPDVFTKTCAQIKKRKLKLGLIPTWYDVDEEENLNRLKKDLFKSKKVYWTKEYLKNHENI